MLQRSSLQRFAHGRMFAPTRQKTDYDSHEVTSAFSGNSRSAKSFQDTHMSSNSHWTSTKPHSETGMGRETSRLGTVYNICQLCSATFISQDEHSAHMTQVHQYVPCPHCDIWCPSPSAIKGHIHREHQPKFVCGLCGKPFHCKINYKGHMNMHSGAKPYTCNKCGKAFAYQQSKHAHQKLCFQIPSTS